MTSPVGRASSPSSSIGESHGRSITVLTHSSATSISNQILSLHKQLAEQVLPLPSLPSCRHRHFHPPKYVGASNLTSLQQYVSCVLPASSVKVIDRNDEVVIGSFHVRI